PDAGLDALRELLQAFAHHLVIVAPERVARHVGAPAVPQGLDGVRGLREPVVHARADHAHGPGHELRRPRPLHAVPLHVFELAVPTELEPAPQPRLVIAKVDAADADLREAELGGPLADLALERSKLGIGQVVAAHRRPGEGPASGPGAGEEPSIMAR